MTNIVVRGLSCSAEGEECLYGEKILVFLA